MSKSSTEIIEYENRTGVKWTIKEDDLKHAFTNGENFTSNTFKASNIPGAKYFLSLETSRDKHISIFLKSCFGTIRKVPASYKIFIKSASYIDEMDYGGFEEYGGCGNIICSSKEKLFDPESKFFVDGIMEVELETTIKTHGIKRKAAKPLSLSELLWEKEEDKDITFVAGGQELKVHKWIISSCSSVFKAELESGMKEASEITITDFSYETVKIAIEHCYEREVDDLINDENASELLHFADKYNIQPLHKLLQIYFIDKLSESNVVDFANLSIKTNAEELRDVCVSFLMKYIGKNTEIKNVKNLDKEITTDVGQRSLLYMSEYEYFCNGFF